MRQEILSGPERRRRWSIDEKVRILAEAEVEGSRVADIARRHDIKVSTTQGTIDPALSTFTIYAWTSTSRGITNPYDLVFRLRPDDGTLAPADVKTEWHGILESTLKGDDLNKLRPDD
jgi:hypothetical protein